MLRMGWDVVIRRETPFADLPLLAHNEGYEGVGHILRSWDLDFCHRLFMA